MATNHTPDFLVTRIVWDMGGRIDRDEDGTVDFTVDGINGLVHIKNDVVRISFFYPGEPEPALLKSFIKSQRTVHGALGLLVPGDYSSTLRFLVTVPVDTAPEDPEWARGVAAEAKELSRQWQVIAPDQDVLMTEIISSMGARINDGDGGGVTFTLDGISGFAHVEDGDIRISFIIARDPEPARAKIFRIRIITFGEIGLVENAAGAMLRFLVTLPIATVPDGRQWAQEVAAEAREIRNDWEGRAQDQEMIDALAEAGLTMPHMGGYPSSAVSTFGAWHWGSRFIEPMGLYIFSPEVIAEDIAENGHLVAMSHAGHGMNSYGLSLVTGQGPLAIYVQHAFGGLMMPPISALMAINATYARIATLFESTLERRDEPCRWLLYLSDFRGAHGIIDLLGTPEGTSGGSAGDLDQSGLTMNEFDRDEARLFAKAAELLGDVAPYNARD